MKFESFSATVDFTWYLGVEDRIPRGTDGVIGIVRAEEANALLYLGGPREII